MSRDVGEPPVPSHTHKRAMSRAYETGWDEGYRAALANVLELGLAATLEREHHVAEAVPRHTDQLALEVR